MASPRRKFRAETQPCATTYSRNRGMTTGPPPKMMVPARKRLAKTENPSGGVARVPRRTMMTMKAAKKAVMMLRPSFQEKTRRRRVGGMMRSVDSGVVASPVVGSADRWEGESVCGGGPLTRWMEVLEAVAGWSG